MAATLDGTSMSLYLNGAKMTKQIDKGDGMFSNSFAKCVGMFVGGSLAEKIHFRGEIDELGLWSRSLGHSEIVENMNMASEHFSKQDLVIAEGFASFNNWEIISSVSPQLVDSDISLPYHTVRLEAPPCGKTVCDDPEVVLSYLNNKQLQHQKRVRYRVVNLMNSNGKNPLVTDKQIHEQHKTLSKIFETYGIDMKVEEINIRNSSLIDKVIMFDCWPHKIGDGRCDQECAHSTLGNDAGDCDRVTSECSRDLLGDGYCNQECNKAYHHFDKGDCCLLGNNPRMNCIDPKHPLR